MSRKDKAEMEGQDGLGWKDASNPWGLFASNQWNQTDSKTLITTVALPANHDEYNFLIIIIIIMEKVPAQLTPFRRFCKALDACEPGADEGQRAVRKVLRVQHRVAPQISRSDMFHSLVYLIAIGFDSWMLITESSGVDSPPSDHLDHQRWWVGVAS
jgi:hypothetical protein